MKTPPLPRTFIGVLFMLAAMFVLPFLDLFAKILGQHGMPIVQIVCGRVVFGTLMSAPFAWGAVGPKMLHSARPFNQIIRASLLITTTVCFFLALKYLPLADTLAIFFVQPLVLTVLSGTFFGETVSARRWAAVMVGFIGVLVIVRPGLTAFNLGSVLALASGCSLALYLALSRKVAGETDAATNTFQTSAFASILLLGIMPWAWTPPTPSEWAMLAAMGVIGSIGQFLIFRAYDYADASLLAPLAYSEMVMSTLVGWLAFSEFPDVWTWVGVSILIASAVYIAMDARSSA